MDLTGEPGAEPQKVGVAWIDIFTGLYGVIGIQAALAERERSGRGQRVDLSLLDVGVAVLANQAMNYLHSGTAPSRLGNAHPNIVPYQVFPAADGLWGGEPNGTAPECGQTRESPAILGDRRASGLKVILDSMSGRRSFYVRRMGQSEQE